MPKYYNENRRKAMECYRKKRKTIQSTLTFKAWKKDMIEEQAAKRELKEETGLDILRIDQWWGPCYSAIGFSNERNACCVGVAGGTFSESTSFQEEIEPRWYTKSEVKELLATEPFAVRTQAYCYCWING